MRRVGIIGNGYVGRGMRSLFALHHHVAIYDPAQLEHQDRDAVMGVDLAVVCVPTPATPDGACDISKVTEVCGWLDAPLVLIKSTVPPGTCENLNAADSAPQYWGRFHFSPEYMGEPRNFVPPWKYPDPMRPHMHDFVIVGGMRAPEVMDFFVPIMGPHTRYVCTDSTTAELAKYMENAYFAMKVSFVTEFYNLARTLDVHWHQLRHLWLLDPRVEPDHTVIFPGDPGWGGKCLPKDVMAICYLARELGTPAFLLESLLAVNRLHRNETGPLGLSFDKDALFTAQQIKKVVDSLNDEVDSSRDDGPTETGVAGLHP